MNMSKKISFAILIVAGLLSCNEKKSNADATGSFEATEVIVSAEASGKIMELALAEGDTLTAGQFLGYIDTTQLHLNKMLLAQNKKAVLSARPDVSVQIESLRKELENAQLDKTRIENLVKGGVASQKQLDDINSKISVLQSRIAAQQSTLKTTTTNINEQGNYVYTQVSLLEDQIRKCKIINPINGTVLAKYAEANEVASAGKPLYKIANLSSIILRIYITGDQLPLVKLGQQLKVYTDNGKGGMQESAGVISWISENAEFTPKTIQTKNERANLVYAAKVLCKNDGRFKIGMYGEVKF
jgi:HlyD family secretion protein